MTYAAGAISAIRPEADEPIEIIIGAARVTADNSTMTTHQPSVFRGNRALGQSGGAMIVIGAGLLVNGGAVFQDNFARLTGGALQLTELTVGSITACCGCCDAWQSYSGAQGLACKFNHLTLAKHLTLHGELHLSQM